MLRSCCGFQSTALVLLAAILILVSAGSVVGQSLLFRDDFEDGNADGWTEKTPYNWQISTDDGQTSYHMWSSGLSGNTQQLNEWSIYQNQVFDDITMHVKARSPEDLSANPLADYAVIFHYQDDDNYYFAFFNSSANETFLMKRVNGIETILATHPNPTIVTNDYVSLAVVTLNGEIRIKANEQEIFKVTDTTFLSGKVGLGARNDAVYFADVTISENVADSQDFIDDFNDNILDGWTAFNTPRWSTKFYGDSYRLFLNTTQYSSPTEHDLGEVIVVDTLTVSDFSFECDLKSTEPSSNSGADLAVVFGYQDSQNYYYVLFNRTSGNTVFRRLQSGIAYDIDSYSGSTLPDNTTWHHVSITRQNGNVDVLYDGQSILQGSDLTFTDGQIGVGSKNDAGYFDNIVVNYSSSTQPSTVQLTFNQIDAAVFPTIDCYVTVADDQNNPILGLDENNFQLFEDQVQQAPITVTSLSNAGEPVSVALVLDRSGSMSGSPMDDAKDAANYFVDQMASNDKGCIVSFDGDITVDQTFTTDKNALHTAINGLVAGGGTYLYDAVVEAVNQCNTQSGRKAIISLTDGQSGVYHYNLDDCILAAQAAGLPVYTIGLGNGIDRTSLQRLADETGGQYFEAPTSSDLEYIYQLISQQIQNQYKITYTTSNPACDGTVRDVQIIVNYQNESDDKNKTYVAPTSCANIPLLPTSPSPEVLPGTSVWVDIHIGSASQPVTDLFGVSFVLNYEDTQYLDVVTPYDDNVIAGPLMGNSNDIVLFRDVDDANGAVSMGVTRKSGTGGVNGYGSVARVQFTFLDSAPCDQVFTFSLTEVSVINSAGAAIAVQPDILEITVTCCVTVWPGDTNNDGVVDVADVLPLGVYFAQTGPQRANAPDNTWTPQSCCPAWNPVAASYADSDGNGKVNQADVFAIGLNYGNTHALAKKKTTWHRLAKAGATANLSLAPIGTGRPNDPYCVIVHIENASDLLGVSYEIVAVENSEYVIFDSLHYSGFLGDDLISYDEINNGSHKVSIGQTRKTEDGGVDGAGELNHIYYHLTEDAPVPFDVSFVFQKVTGNDSQGNPIEFTVEDANVNVAVELTQFVAQATGKGVELRWTTASETNNLGFAVERRAAASQDMWTEVAFINGQGTTTDEHDYIYFDENVSSGTWEYRLKDVSFSGDVNYSQSVGVTVHVIAHYELKQNYPNPFNPETSIQYALPEETHVTLEIYDIRGTLMKKLVDSMQPAGDYSVSWDATDLNDRPAPSGIYLYRLSTTDYSASRRMILLR